MNFDNSDFSDSGSDNESAVSTVTDEEKKKQLAERERTRKKNLLLKKKAHKEFVDACKEKAEDIDMETVFAAVNKSATSFINECVAEMDDIKFHKHAKGLLNKLMLSIFQGMVDGAVASVQTMDKFGSPERVSRQRPVMDANAVFNGTKSLLAGDVKKNKSQLVVARHELMMRTGFFKKKKKPEESETKRVRKDE